MPSASGPAPVRVSGRGCGETLSVFCRHCERTHRHLPYHSFLFSRTYILLVNGYRSYSSAEGGSHCGCARSVSYHGAAQS